MISRPQQKTGRATLSHFRQIPKRVGTLRRLALSPQNLKTGAASSSASVSAHRAPSRTDSAPTFVLIGDSDIADVIAYGGAIEAAVPIVSFEVWKNCGHLIQLERPAELVARLQRFAALADRRKAAVSAAELLDLVGEYEFLDRRIAISPRNDRLWLGLPDTPDRLLFAASNSRFFVRTTETEFQFERDSAGKIVKLVIFNSDGNKIECPRA